jgi:hypothetical protein
MIDDKKSLISKRTLYVFYDLLSGYGTLREIEKLFEGEEIFKSEEYVSSFSGQRRSLADEYIRSLDLNNGSDVKKLLQVFEMFYIEHENNEYFKNDLQWKQFQILLERDGYNFIGNSISQIASYIPIEIKEIASSYNIEHVEKEWERALKQAKIDPEDAITATRSMVESTLKWILEKSKVEYDHSDNLNHLYKKVSRSLNLYPDQHGEEIFKQILGSINGVVTGLGSLRNAYGDAHGKGIKYYKPSERHAKFAINLSGTLCIYLLETYMYQIDK